MDDVSDPVRKGARENVRNGPLYSQVPLAGRNASSRPVFALALLLALLQMSPRDAAAAAGDPTATGWLHLETDLSVTPEILDTRWSSLVRAPSSTPDYSLASAAPAAAWSALSHAPTLIDIAPQHLAAGEPQTYVRPQFALGASSDSLRGWLRFAGINASTCTAPLMKMHSSFAGSSSHAKVSLSARCSVH
jgi:hypothetical protein